MQGRPLRPDVAIGTRLSLSGTDRAEAGDTTLSMTAARRLSLSLSHVFSEAIRKGKFPA